MRSKKKLIVGGVFLAVTLVLIGLVVIRGPKKLEVKTAEATMSDVEQWYSGTGALSSGNSKKYFALTQAVVDQINVKVGDSVKKGDTMVVFDMTTQQFQYDQARLQYNNAQLSLSSARDGASRIEKTIKELDAQIAEIEARLNNPAVQAPSTGDNGLPDITSGAQNAGSTAQDYVTLIQLQSQKSTLEASRVSSAQIKQLENAVELAKLALDTAEESMNTAKQGIIADFDGIVSLVGLIEGAPPSLTQPAIVLDDTSSVKAMISLGKYDIEKVQVGQKATVKIPGTAFDATVSFVSPVATISVGLQGQTSSISAEVTIQNPNNKIKLGFESDVSILTGSVKNVLTVPVEAVRTDAQGSFCYILVDEKVKRVSVTLGISSDELAEVVSGINPGDKIILNPSAEVEDGALAVAIE